MIFKSTNGIRNLHFSVTQPLFLYRNLSYMQHRSTRTNKERNTFNVNSLLERVQNLISSRLGDYLTLTFLGYFDTNITMDNNDMDVVEIKTYLSKHNDIEPNLDWVSAKY